MRLLLHLSHSMEDMVSFKNNNVVSEQSPPTPRCLSGSLRGSRAHNQRRNQQQQQHHPERNDSAATTIVQPQPPNTSIDAGYTVHHGCALHTRLDQPVTSSMSGMDSKKVVQASTPTTVTVPLRSKSDGPGSVSGVRRRSGPQGGGLRSPAAKRPPSAPVALQGWLHKQGSEGLMLWKKRWFVLSEYCLFYYKGPEEEKLLGSILLPSYRVTVCKPEDKVNKKFAFKAEHANMRTYHFAADNRDSMNQWVNALTLATLLQDPSPGAGDAVVIDMAGQQDGERSGRPSVSSISSILNQSADDSDSGFHGFQSRDDPSHASNNNSSPNSVNTASFPNLSASNSNGNTGIKTNPNVINNNNTNDSQPIVNGWIHQQSQYVQPGTSQQKQQQPSQQYSHLIPSPQQHLHQSHLHQHMLHQEAPSHNQAHQHKQLVYQQQQSHPLGSNVQTVQPMPRKFGQPIYANAPPKPRRLTDGSTEYSTPSPDPDYRKSPVSPDVIALSKSPISDYERNGAMIYGTRMNQPSQQSLRTDKSGLNYGYAQAQSTERRTPDTYGRSAKPRSTGSNGSNARPNGGDYEEVYGAPQLYQRPAGPVVGYTKGASPAPIPIPVYTPHHHQFQQPQQLQSPVASSNLVITRQPRAQPPPRPHSADFLEYEATRRPQQQIPAQCDESISQQRRTPQRPKSSLDIVTTSDPANDGYFYSEERYAAQMRQSAVYLHQTPQHHQQQRNQSLSRATMPAKLTGIRDRSDESRISTLPEAPCSTAPRTAHREHLHQQQQQHVMPLQRHTEVNSSEAKLRRSLRETSYDASICRDTLTRLEEGGGASTVPRRIPDYEAVAPAIWARHGVQVGHQTCQSANTVGRRWNEQQQQQQQFCRSASARLPRTRHPAALDADDDDEDDYGERSSEQDSRDGERRLQQREESMKRLLEWKQRMLQSPLTRKPSGSRSMGGGGSIAAGTRGRTQNELSSYYKQQALLDLAAHEASIAEARHSRRREDSHRPHVRSKSSDGRRTIANVSRYNSYSSDDEELGDVRRKRTRRPSHAGRSPRHPGTADDRLSGGQQQDIIPAGTRTGQVGNASLAVDHQQPSSRTSAESKTCGVIVLSGLGGIPPDAGYEEVSFPSSQTADFPTSSYTTVTEKGSMRRNDREMINLSGDSTPDGYKGLRKPSSILKSCSAYTVEQQQQQQQQQPKTEGRLEGAGGDSHGAKGVQWTGRREQDDWDSNIDEEKLIKEFSYQYIKPRKEESIESRREEESSPGKTETMNLVRCRIRSFEMSQDGSSPVKEVLSMQEPLKVSPLQVTEAHVSRIDPSKKNSAVIRNFALGEASSQDASKQRSTMGDHVKQASTDSNKSVKDILADFEQKTQQAQKQEYNRRSEVRHRGVFSDTETLLYNSASDVDQLEKSEKEKKRQRKHESEAEDGNGDNQAVPEFFAGEEGRTTYGGTLKGKPDVPFRDKKKSVKPGLPGQTNLENEEDREEEEEEEREDGREVTSEPNCARLSVTESLLTHGGQLSEESDTPSPSEKQEDINPEEHYLPMSPRKAILDPNTEDRPNPNMMESLFANLGHEESSYVEMALNGMNHSLLAPDEKGRKHDSGDYSTLDTPHYEFVCVSDSKMEPVYMEVSQLSEKEEKEAGRVSVKKRSLNEEASHSRTDLPDILTALKSDSSDADDESSKDLDSIDAPRHPRFSLSDTFRPASYYLGASRTMIAELHDSSDSELVSPPPIPTSPPPLDDLDSLDMQESLEIKKVSPQVAVAKDNNTGSNCDSPKSWNKPMGQVETHRPPSRFSDATISSTFRDSRMSLESGASGSDSVIEPRNPEEEARRHRQLKRRPVSDEVCEVLDSLDELESLGSRFDRASIDLDQYLEELQARDAFNVDLYTKDLSYNGIYGFNENMLIVDKLQKTTCHDLSRQMNLMSQQFPYNGGSRNKIGSASSLPSMRVCDVPPSHQHSQSFTGDAHYENVANFVPVRPDIEQVRRDTGNGGPQRNSARSNCSSHARDYPSAIPSSISASMEFQRPSSAQSSASRGQTVVNPLTGQHQTLSPSSQDQNRYQSHARSASQDSAQYSLISNHRSSSSQDSGQHYPIVNESYLPVEQRSQSDQPGAPYYYSDLQASTMNGLDQEAPKPIGHTSRLPQLNNQRDDASGLNKRNDIGRITNPIARQLPRQIQVEDIDEARRIAAELRRTTCQLLGDNKADLVDKRNFYEADTLRRVKSNDPLPDLSLPQVSTRNLYPHGLRDKSNSQASNPESTYDGTPNAQASHRRSRSLEGLLDDVGLQNLMEQQRNLSNHRTSVESTRQEERPGQNVTSTSGNQTTTGGNFHAEDPWEQDSLWRESLRRVSLRNARSLDNLDDRTRSNDPRGRARITRGATYVNDSVALRRGDICPEECDRPSDRGPRVKRRPNGSRRQEREQDTTTGDCLRYEAVAIDRISPDGYRWDEPRAGIYRKAGRTEEDTNRDFLEDGNLHPSGLMSEARMSEGTTTASGSFELDREKLRQWDLLSSACLLQEQQQRGSMADSGRGLLTAGVPELPGGSVLDEKNGIHLGNDVNDRTTGAMSTGLSTMTSITVTTTTTTTTTTALATSSMTSETTTTVPGIGGDLSLKILNTQNHQDVQLTKELTKRQEVREQMDACNRATGEWLLKAGGVYRK